MLNLILQIACQILLNLFLWRWNAWHSGFGCGHGGLRRR
jgi:hypothetical protein